VDGGAVGGVEGGAEASSDGVVDALGEAGSRLGPNDHDEDAEGLAQAARTTPSATARAMDRSIGPIIDNRASWPVVRGRGGRCRCMKDPP
jgi:hypothetical protein